MIPLSPILIGALSFFGIEFSSLSDLQFINHVLLWLGLLCFLLVFVKKSPLIFGVIQLLIIFYLYRVGIEYSSKLADQHSTVPALAIFTFLLAEVFFKDKTKWPYGKLFTLSVLGDCLECSGIILHMFLLFLWF